MRNCDNCIHGSYNLDCNDGLETLYCRESEYEYEVDPLYSCQSHQFIEGIGNEQNFILYDESYLGKGFFIVHMKDNDIAKFFKIYRTNNEGYINYKLRVFSDDKSNDNIEFVFRSFEDFDNSLFDAFLKFGRYFDNESNDTNIFSIILGSGYVKFIISKNTCKEIKQFSNFIDINLGDNSEVEDLYNELEKNCNTSLDEENIKRLVMSKIN